MITVETCDDGSLLEQSERAAVPDSMLGHEDNSGAEENDGSIVNEGKNKKKKKKKNKKKPCAEQPEDGCAPAVDVRAVLAAKAKAKAAKKKSPTGAAKVAMAARAKASKTKKKQASHNEIPSSAQRY